MNRAKILLVEDEDILQRMYKQKLLLEGFDPVVALDGEDGLNKLATENPPPDLILLDIMLPKLDGIEVLRRIKSDDKLKNIPVVMLTNNVNPEMTEKAMTLGASGYLMKSDKTPNEVITFIRQILGQNSSQTNTS